MGLRDAKVLKWGQRWAHDVGQREWPCGVQKATQRA